MIISDQDKEMIYSLYMDDKELKFEGLASLYGAKYPGITANTIENIIRTKHNNGSPRIIFNEAPKRVDMFKHIEHREINNLQKDRNKK